MNAPLHTTLESTLLGPDVTEARIEELCQEAVRLDLRGVCVAPIWLPRAAAVIGSSSVRLVTVANFPFGDLEVSAVRATIGAAAESGAQEIDVVAPLHLAREAAWAEYERFLAEALEPLPSIRYKVILETAALPEEAIRRAAGIAASRGAAWVKTSTGFHPAGGAAVRAVSVLRASVPAEVGVKASGGIRTPDCAHALLEAGADILGTSSAGALFGR